MLENINRLKGLILDDHALLRSGLKSIIQSCLNVELEEFGTGQSLLSRISEASKNNEHIDFISTDINHPNIDGLELIKTIRGLSDSVLFHNGLRLKYIPIVVVSVMDTPRVIKAIQKLSKEIIFTPKDAKPSTFIKNIVTTIANYRRGIIEEFTAEGYSIQFQDGKYNINPLYNIPPFINTKYFEGISDSASKAATRRILIQNTSSFAKVSIAILQDLLNNSKTKERDLHDFFRMFPEFLLDNNYDIIYSENSFASLNHKLRTDIVAQPRGLREDNDKWAIVELKKHTEKILTNRKYHANFCKSVYNAITQLKNYQDYFNNPSNYVKIQKKFGVVPNPKLCLVIGRTPTGKINLFEKMKNQFPGINISTYDEVLRFRKIQIEFMESMGL